MRKIAIIGAGQAGLQLGIGLLKNNFTVSLFSNKNAEQILYGKILSSQGMFYSALKNEASLGLNFWDNQATWNKTVTFTLLAPETHKKTIFWQGNTKMPYLSIDQRLKFSRWLNEFVQEGGHFYNQDVQLEKLEAISNEYDLTIVASGKSEICQIFPRNEPQCQFDTPARKLSCLYIQNTTPAVGKPGVRTHIIPGVGEYFIMPGLTITGACEMMLFEGLPGGAFDCWQAVENVNQQLEIAKELLRKFVPWEYERCRNSIPTDENAGLTGGYIPYVRHPYAKMSNGKYVFGIGDVVVLNDPIAGQGANNASKAADIYLKSILKNRDTDFDKNWMQETFDSYWEEYAKWATQWTTLLLKPPPPHVLSLLEAASKSKYIANRLADTFDNPKNLFPWIMDNDKTLATIALIKSSEEQKLAILPA